jgi:hypothetical protein
MRMGLRNAIGHSEYFLPIVNRILSVNVALLELLKNLFINRIFEVFSFDFSIDEIYIPNLLSKKNYIKLTCSWSII